MYRPGRISWLQAMQNAMNFTKLKCFSHKSCYKSKSRNNEQKKRKDALAHTVVSKRLLKSQCNDFMFKRDCLLCGNVCKMKDSKNPHRWVEVRQCKTVNRGSAVTFKQQLNSLYGEREDQWGEWCSSESKWGH